MSQIRVRRISPAPVVGDVVAVLIFAAIGRASHEEGMTVLGVLETAWPFLAGLLVGWAVVNMLQVPGERIWPAGVAIWGSVLAVGLVLRGLTGAGLSMPFPIIAGVSLAVVLLAPRAIGQFLLSREK